MDKCLRPQVFSAGADTADGAMRWQHWKRTLKNYLRRIDNISAGDKLDVLISLLNAAVYTYIRECASYQEAIDCLENIYVKPVNEVYARHKLNTCRQKSEEKIEEFFNVQTFLALIATSLLQRLFIIET